MTKEIKIPLFDLNFDEQEEEAVLETLRSKWISIGPKNSQFEKMFSEMIGSEYAVSLSSCTGSLHLAMRILNLKEGDEVICPSLTFVATVNAIKFVGAIPVFCDITSLENPVIDPDEIEKLITDKTKAVVVMHYAGFPCDMDAINLICQKYNIKLVEDACHAPLSEYNGKVVGTQSDMSCYSFFSNKNMSTGEGGMLVTNNPDYFDKAKLLRSHGMTTLSYERAKGHSTGYDVIDLGYNYRMDDIRASIGIVQLSKLRNDIEQRQKIRKLYIDKLSEIDELIIPFKYHNEFSSNYIFPIVLKNSTGLERNKLRNDLLNKGIQTSVHYPAVHLFDIYYKKGLSLPKTEYFSENEITLPLFAKLSEDNLEYVCSNLKESIYNLEEA